MQMPENQSPAEFLAAVEPFSALTRPEVEKLAQSAQSRSLAFGDPLCNAGELATGVFIVKSGSLRVFATERERERSLGVLKAGELFGELAMLGDYRHEWSARASGKTELLFVPRSAIAPILTGNKEVQASVAARAAINAAALLLRHLFDLKSTINKPEPEELTRHVGVKRVGAGHEILKQGSEEDRRLYVVRQGAVGVVRHEEGRDYPLATLHAGETFGESACLLRRAQTASVVASEEDRKSVV